MVEQAAFRPKSDGDAEFLGGSKRRQYLSLVSVAMLSFITFGCSTASDVAAVSPTAATKVGYPSKLLPKTTVATKKATGRTPVRVAGNVYLGRAPYICSPSGFGMTSKCFAR